MKIRVFIADDHVLVRKGLRQVLEESDNIVVVGEAADYTGLAAGQGREVGNAAHGVTPPCVGELVRPLVAPVGITGPV